MSQRRKPRGIVQSEDVYQSVKEWCSEHGYQIGNFYEFAALIAIGRRDSVPGEFLDLVDENGVEAKLDALLDHHGISGDGDTPTRGEGSFDSPIGGNNNITDDEEEDDKVVESEGDETDTDTDAEETELLEAAKESGEAFSWDEMKEWASIVQALDDEERRDVRLHPDRVGQLKRSRDTLMPVFYGIVAHEQNEMGMPWYSVSKVKEIMMEYYPDEDPSEHTLFKRGSGPGNYLDNMLDGWFVESVSNDAVSTNTEVLENKMDELLETGLEEFVQEARNDEMMGMKKAWKESKPESYAGSNSDYYDAAAIRTWLEWFEVGAEALDSDDVEQVRDGSVNKYEGVHEHIRWAAYEALSDSVREREYDVVKRPETPGEKRVRDQKDNRSDKANQKDNLLTF